MSDFPPNIWPRGRLNRRASTEDLKAERDWQVQFLRDCRGADGHRSLRVRAANQNIQDIDAELQRRPS